MRADVRDWFRRRSSAAVQWPAELCLEAKKATTISVVLPALDEEQTVGHIVSAIRRDLMDSAPLVDELLVIDSGSGDRTPAVALDAGARVVHREAVLPSIPSSAGKGEAMWRGLAATSGDIVVFIDADLRAFSSSYVTGLLGPLLTDDSVAFVKAMYDRPLEHGGTIAPAGGGRVTELVARPLINLHWPELSGFVQPLAGEVGARRCVLEQLRFPTGYGVDLALLVDTLRLVGLDAMAQVDLGVRRHRHQPDQRLALMAGEIWHAALDRLDQDGLVERRRRAGTTLAHFSREGHQFVASTRDMTVGGRPPMCTVPDYVTRAARAS